MHSRNVTGSQNLWQFKFKVVLWSNFYPLIFWVFHIQFHENWKIKSNDHLTPKNSPSFSSIPHASFRLASTIPVLQSGRKTNKDARLPIVHHIFITDLQLIMYWCVWQLRVLSRWPCNWTGTSLHRVTGYSLTAIQC